MLHNYNFKTIEQLLVSPFSSSPDNHLAFSAFMIFIFLDISCKYNYTVIVLLWQAYFNQHSVLQVHPCGSSFLRVDNIRLYVYTIFSLSIDLSVDTWVSSIICMVWIMVCTAVSLILISIFYNTHSVFSIVAKSFHIPTNESTPSNFSTSFLILLSFAILIKHF